jgi:hypothetical protein
LQRALLNETPVIHTVHRLNSGYENDIRIKDKYFAAIYGLHICPIKPPQVS